MRAHQTTLIKLDTVIHCFTKCLLLWIIISRNSQSIFGRDCGRIMAFNDTENNLEHHHSQLTVCNLNIFKSIVVVPI